MREIKIAYHYVDTAWRDWPLPVDDIVAAFRSASIAVELTEGDGLLIDPNGKANTGYQALLERLPREPLGKGHLFIGLQAPYDKTHIAGELLDLSKRRACAVYTSSVYFMSNAPDALLQTAVHEIGHMLNLGHASPSPGTSYAMHQIRERSGSIKLRWEAERTNAQQLAAQGLRPYFVDPGRPISCFPFSLQERMRLNEQSDFTILPNGGQYIYAAGYSGD